MTTHLFRSSSPTRRQFAVRFVSAIACIVAGFTFIASPASAAAPKTAYEAVGFVTGSENTPVAVTVTAPGSSITLLPASILSEEAYSEPGYVFVGWQSHGAIYLAGTTYVVTSSVTFTAVWKKVDLLSISFNANGGSGDFLTQDVAPGTQVILPTGAPWHDQYCTFGGWTDGVNVYEGGDSYAVNVDVTLTAVCNPTDVLVVFSPGSGHGAPRRRLVKQGSVIVVPDEGSFAKTGFCFAGWRSATTTLRPGAFFIATHATTLTAQWSECT